MTGAILKSQKQSSKSRACLAINWYSFLTPFWCWNRFTCDQPIIIEHLCFHFIGEQSPTAFMAGCSSAESWWSANFWVDDRLRPCKHISLMSPSSIFNVELSARVGEQQHPVPTCFVDCNFFFLQFNYINRNVSHHIMSDLQSWLSGQSVALNKREIASSGSSSVLLP